MEQNSFEKKETKKEAFSGFSRSAKAHPVSFFDLLKMYLFRLYHSKMIYIVYAIVALIAIIACAILFELNAQDYKHAIEAGQAANYSPSHVIADLALWCFSIPLSSPAPAMIDSNQLLNLGITLYFPLGFIALFIIAFFVGKDWRNRTFRNQLLAGHSRLEIYFAAQITSLIIALALVVVWELTVWVAGLAFQLPAFRAGQFDYVLTNGAKYFGNAPAAFTLSFFMDLLIFLAFAVVACAWCFIIPNSWGAVGLLYATLELINIVSTIVYAVGTVNFNSYYLFQEWLLPYQLSMYSNYIADRYYDFTFSQTSGWSFIVGNGRGGLLAMKTVLASLLLLGGMGYLGALSFTKRDLK